MTATDQLSGKLLEIINQVQNTVTNHAADAVNLALSATSVNGIVLLMFVFIGFIVSAGVTLSPVIHKCKSEKCEHKRFFDETWGFFFITGAFAILFFLMLIYPWNWIQVFNPKLYLAHEIIQKVMQ